MQDTQDTYYYVTYFDANETQYGDADDCYETIDEAKDAAKAYKYKAKDVAFTRACVTDRRGYVLWYTY